MLSQRYAHRISSVSCMSLLLSIYPSAACGAASSAPKFTYLRRVAPTSPNTKGFRVIPSLLTGGAIMGTALSIKNYYYTNYQQHTLCIMPGEEELQHKLDAIGLHNFAQHTNFITTIANHEHTPQDIVTAVRTATQDYFSYLETHNTPPELRIQERVLMPLHTSLLYKALLHNQPEALQELEQAGIYKPLE